MCKRQAFTLVELLIVILVIGILVAILLPVLSRMRRSADRLKCATNLRQVGLGLLMYANDNREYFPEPALKDPVGFFSKSGYNPEDWIHWQPGRDITESRIWKYIGNNDKSLECPADQARSGRAYPYSFTINVRITGHISSRTLVRGNTQWGINEHSVKLSRIVRPAQKLLVVEESGETIDDGGFYGGNSALISVRHETDREGSDPMHDPEYVGNLKRRGNVFFVDGHCDFIPRHLAWRYFDPLLR